MPHIERDDGVRIYYEEHGSGLPVLLTHGYGASLRMWQPQVEALSSRYRLILWDMRGHDRSDSPETPNSYTHKATVDDVAAILDACNVDRAVVGGLSLGGFVSLAFHLEHAERVRALMLFDTGPGYKSDAGRQRWNDWAERRALEFEQEGLAASTSSPEVKAARHEHGPMGLALAARGILKQHDSRVIESLPSIRVPTLVVAGGDDKDFLVAADYMAAKIPAAVKIIIDGAGHAPNIEKWREFNAAVSEFLDALPAE